MGFCLRFRFELALSHRCCYSRHFAGVLRKSSYTPGRPYRRPRLWDINTLSSVYFTSISCDVHCATAPESLLPGYIHTNQFVQQQDTRRMGQVCNTEPAADRNIYPFVKSYSLRLYVFNMASGTQLYGSAVAPSCSVTCISCLYLPCLLA